MNKILNILTIIFGAVLTIAGIAKLTGNFDEFTVSSGDYYLTMPNYTWTALVLVFDLGGGLSMVLHGLTTFNFKSDKLEGNDDLIDSLESLENIKLSRIAGFTGRFVLVSCAWLLIWLIASFSGLAIGQFLTLVLMLIGIVAPFIIIPSILVFKNLSLNTKIRNKIKAKKLAEFHAKRKASGQPKRK